MPVSDRWIGLVLITYSKVADRPWTNIHLIFLYSEINLYPHWAEKQEAMYQQAMAVVVYAVIETWPFVSSFKGKTAMKTANLVLQMAPKVGLTRVRTGPTQPGVIVPQWRRCNAESRRSIPVGTKSRGARESKCSVWSGHFVCERSRRSPAELQRSV